MTQGQTQVKADHLIPPAPAGAVFRLDDVHVSYGRFLALRGVTLEIGGHEITAFIGPSGCGKSTLIRCLNRMNDLIPGARVEGRIDYHGQDLYGDGVDPVEVRRRIGMVFQKPNPFPKSIYDNVAFGPKVIGMRPESMDELVERSGTRSRTSSSRTLCRSPAASSSGSASPGRSPCRRT
jgi:phosphate transport system ATP-binding protein